MSGHTAEPWCFDKNNSVNGVSHYMVGVEGTIKAVALTGKVGAGDDEESISNARRIVACVNACAGMTTESLDKLSAVVVSGEPINEMFCQIEKQRDELLAALKGLTDGKCVALGDLVYDIREREGEGWEGPKVVAWGKAVETASAVISRIEAAR